MKQEPHLILFFHAIKFFTQHPHTKNNTQIFISLFFIYVNSLHIILFCENDLSGEFHLKYNETLSMAVKSS